MADIAELGLAVRYTDIDKANASLNKFAGSAKGAEVDAKKFAAALKQTGGDVSKITPQMLGLASATKNMGDGATSSARKMVAANDNIRRSVNRLGGAYRQVVRIAGVLGVTLSAAVFGRVVKGAIDAADAVGKMSQRIGVQVSELSRLTHAADLSGLAMEEMATGVQLLSRNMASFASGGSNEASKVFQRLGVSVTDSSGKLRSASDVMAQVADRFASMPDGAQKTAAAMDLFGRSGARMIPLLNQGAAGLKGMMEEADRLGITISGATAKAAEEFNDNLTRLGGVMRGIVTQMAAHLLPTLQQLSAQLVATATDGDRMKTWADNISTAMRWVVDITMRAIAGIQGMRAEIAGLSEALSLLGDLEFSAARDAWNKGQAEFVRIQTEMEKRLHDLWSGKGDRLDIAQPFKAATPVVEEFGGALETVTDNLDKLGGSSSAGGGAAIAAKDAIQGVGDAAKDATESAKSLTRGFLGDLVDGFKAGASAANSFKAALTGVLDKLANMGLDMVTTPMFGEVGTLNLERKSQ